ncbi:MAG: carbohydrate kinase family protein [Actinomycetia bacterium]|nr:carbohydrate kinase family protein [Actinomycetes bacterium]
MAVIAIIGSTAKDRVDGGPPRPGGTPHYALDAIKLVGSRMVAVTKVGRGDEALLEGLRSPTAVLHPRVSPSTLAFSHVNDGDERTSSIADMGEPWTPAEIREWVAPAVARCDALHVGALSRADFLAESVAALREVAGPDRLLSLDAQGLVRPGRCGPVVEDSHFDRTALQHLDVLKFAEIEARAAGLTLEVESLGALGVPEVIVTLGRRGALLCFDGVLEHIDSDVVEVTDATGMGDRFAAVYVAQRAAGDEPGSAASRAARAVAELLRREAA